MYPIKQHRIVRHGAAMVGGEHDRGGAAMESAENEGWPSQGLGMLSQVMRLRLHGHINDEARSLPVPMVAVQCSRFFSPQ